MGGAIGRDQEQLCRHAAAGEYRDHVQGRIVDPVEIFQDHNQRALRRHSLECFANLPHHPSWRASQDLSLEPVSLFGFYQGWELSQAGGRMFRQHLDQRTVFRAENQRAQRFEDRVVRFRSPEALDTLTLASRRFGRRVACCWNTSTSAVLPMPASPVTKMACRWPRRALARQTSSSARAVLRPTTLFVSEPGKGAALSSLTGAMNWYPRLGKVSIYAGFSGSSPRALRIPRIYCFMTSGLTYVSGQRASRISSCVTRRSACSTR